MARSADDRADTRYTPPQGQQTAQFSPQYTDILQQRDVIKKARDKAAADKKTQVTGPAEPEAPEAPAATGSDIMTDKE